MIDSKFGRLTITAPIIKGDGRKRWQCKCDCGKIIAVRDCHIKSGRSKSCGCLSVELFTKRVKKHGLSNKTPEYDAWLGMIKRCYNTGDWNKAGVRNYSGRGITVCQAWLDSFEAFLSHVGKRPSAKHSLDRIDNNKGYEPGNVRWADNITQSENRRTNLVITLDGESKPLSRWCRIFGIPYGTAISRIRRGWSHRNAILTPIKKRC